MRIAKTLLFLTAAAIFAQPGQPPAFEAATIKVNASSDPESGDFVHGRLTLHRAPLRDLIGSAYGIRNDLIQGGPKWVETTRFDVAAKADPATAEATSRLMLQTLLAERFRLIVHRGESVTSVYVLKVAKNGPKLQPSPPDSRARKGCVGSAPLICHDVTTHLVS